MFIQQKIRVVLFYSSLFIFFAGLPIILSYALGYKFDRRTFKFTQTGLIFLKTQPSQANIYLDGKLLTEKTPATLRELLPGNYYIRAQLEGYYPWFDVVKVAQRHAAIFDKIILFPLRPNIRKINEERLDYFWVEEENGLVYCVDYDLGVVFISDNEGAHHEKAVDFLKINPLPLKWKLSSDREKFLYFNGRQIGIAYAQSHWEKASGKASFVIGYPDRKINDVFWHADNYHLIVVTDKNIGIIEARPEAEPVELISLNKKGTPVYHSVHDNALYFMDSQTSAEGIDYDNLYKLELNNKAFNIKELMKLRQDE